MSINWICNFTLPSLKERVFAHGPLDAEKALTLPSSGERVLAPKPLSVDLLCLFIICFLLILQGCKVGYSLNGASIPVEAKTVTVLYFTNNSALAPPTLSQQFTEAMKDICATQTKLALTNKGGDLSFEGYISDYKVTPIAIQTNDMAALNRLTISVQIKYINKFDEKKNFESTFSRFADFSSTLSLASQEATLIPLINKQLTEDIFNKAFNNW